MTARWEPLSTAEEVVAAMRARRHVERSAGNGRKWTETTPEIELYTADYIWAGWQYRALIEDSK